MRRGPLRLQLEIRGLHVYKIQVKMFDLLNFVAGIYTLAIPPPRPGRGEQFLSKLKNREESKGGLHEKKKGKEKKVIKHTL